MSESFENMDNWVISEKYPGYYCKTLHIGIHTVEIYRPILTPEERAVVEKRVMDDLARATRAEIAARQRKEKTA